MKDPRDRVGMSQVERSNYLAGKGSGAGKGDGARNCFSSQFRSNFDVIFKHGSKEKSQKACVPDGD